jgi:integrase
VTFNSSNVSSVPGILACRCHVPFHRTAPRATSTSSSAAATPLYAAVGEPRPRLACPKGEGNLVFPTETGSPMSPSNLLHRGFYPALKRAGLRKVRFHDLRHSFASLALAGGENLGPVSKQLGHASTAITLTIYRHVLPGEGRGMSDRLAARVADADGGEVANAPAKKPGAA